MSITKGADSYADGDPVPLGVGTNLITIEVTASDGSTAPHTYSVTVTRAPNTPPVFDEGRAATRGVDEDTVANQRVGDPLSASDADNADTLTYSLDTASEAFFDIDSTTGQLRTEAELDHETRKSYPVTVSVSDGKDANSDADPSADDHDHGDDPRQRRERGSVVRVGERHPHDRGEHARGRAPRRTVPGHGR